eukprot:TRINITY_DN6864_c0_g1_i1.p1 TRINITY_DN6864_c0_g1~~TRINITY_DN6864_c0_g1_i1.p1  ORF type:complete len:780 (+),score=203.80 TRINITY_DN6864_c0_g1_i1:61-2400(+)
MGDDAASAPSALSAPLLDCAEASLPPTPRQGTDVSLGDGDRRATAPQDESGGGDGKAPSGLEASRATHPAAPKGPPPGLASTPAGSAHCLLQQEQQEGRPPRQRRPSHCYTRPDPRLRHPDVWPHYPVLCRCGPGLPVNIDCDPQNVPLNPRVPVHFETPLFRGRVYLSVRNCPRASTDPWGPGQRFAPKRRKLVLTVQGTFKERLRMDTVQTGWEWAQPLRNLPWGISKAEHLIRVCGGPGSATDLCNKQRPYLLNLLCCGADAIHIWDPQCDPPEQQFDITAGICPERSSWPDVKQRQQALGAGKQAAKHYFETEPTYTFDFYGDKMDVAEWVVHLPLLGKYGLVPYLGPQPLPFLARTLQGDYLWNFEMWHAHALPLLPPAAVEDAEEDMSYYSAPPSELSTGSFHSAADADSERRSAYASFGDGDGPHPPRGGRADGPRRGLRSSFADFRRRKGRRWRAAARGKVNFGALRGRWDAWDVPMPGHDSRNPRPGDALCAFMASAAFTVVLVLACTWWSELIAQRVRAAVERWPSAYEWFVTFVILLGMVCVGLPLGTMTDWWRRGDKGQGNWVATVCAAWCAWGVLEEIAFRAALMPGEAEGASGREVVMWFTLSVTAFVTHFGLLAATCMRVGYPTFFDPRFQALAAVLGSGCSAAFVHTHSLWPSVALHLLCMTCWLAIGGGARRLRRVRFRTGGGPLVVDVASPEDTEGGDELDDRVSVSGMLVTSQLAGPPRPHTPHSRSAAPESPPQAESPASSAPVRTAGTVTPATAAETD